MADAFSLEGLVKRFGDVLAVDDVSVRVAPGEVVALLGPNGAGKSTTIDMLLGLTRPDVGQVRVAGVSAAEAMDRGTVGAMAQNGTLLRDATVAELVGLFASLHRNPLPTREVLKRAGVAEYANRRCGKLSGGEQQRVRFALALVGDPDLLVLDEPTAAMDVDGRRRFWASMREYTETGRTVVFATHYLAEAEDYADRVVLMRHGRVVADGPVGEVRAAVAGRVLRAVVPNATHDTEAALAALPGVSRAVLRAGRAELSCADSDLAIRGLLREFPDAANIEITAVGLEEAFIALTADVTEGVSR
ncbi:ABC transporter ATP-binding protein [Amycolatopsis azurea]|uniref:ABC transporter ATP-binding protein n=1 Tax=Amycolatopsis azurea DSM 43854 TaxID=1238180 RepID=M2QPE9_9PSEU|nr:ABC transporter ATP-binding protein [Amycolatopsis azurea]EMD28556.1 putative ABC transporter ATP-binding protein [Amycolatopsis azurea DSM 43854]OOC02219.1 ABC transporter ATP-binding protein [Amycolatopsis azurea DSM 43854]